MDIKDVNKVFISKEENRIYIEARNSRDNNDFSLKNGCKMIFKENNTLHILEEDTELKYEDSGFIVKGVRAGVRGEIDKGNLIEFNEFGGYWFARFIGADDLRDTYAPNEPKEISTSLHNPFSITCKEVGTQGVLEIRKTYMII